MVKLAFVQFNSDGQKAVLPITAIKDFNPNHCLDFDENKKDYEVLWELEGGETKYFMAKILCLAASDRDLIQKEKDQKRWKLPRSYVNQFACSPPRSVKPNNSEGTTSKQEKKRQAEATSQAFRKRMKKFLSEANNKEERRGDNGNSNDPKKEAKEVIKSTPNTGEKKNAKEKHDKSVKPSTTAAKDKPEEEKDQSEIKKKKGKGQEDQRKSTRTQNDLVLGNRKVVGKIQEKHMQEDSTHKLKERDGTAETSAVPDKSNLTDTKEVVQCHVTDSVQRSLFQSDDEISGASSDEMLVSSKELDESKEEVKKLKGILKVSSDRREKLQKENALLWEKMARLEKMYMQLQGESKIEVNDNDMNAPKVNDNDWDTSRYEDKDKNTHSPGDGAGNTFDEDKSRDKSSKVIQGGGSGFTEGNNKKIDLDGEKIDLDSEKIELVHETTPVKTTKLVKGEKKTDDDGEDLNLQVQVAKRILKDLKGEKLIETADQKVNIGEGVLVHACNWEEIKKSSNPKSFIGALLRAVWGRAVLGTKTLKGGQAKHSKDGVNKPKTALTPLKLNVVLGAIRAYHENDGLLDNHLVAAVNNSKRTISSKLNDDAKWLRLELERQNKLLEEENQKTEQEKN